MFFFRRSINQRPFMV